MTQTFPMVTAGAIKETKSNQFFIVRLFEDSTIMIYLRESLIYYFALEPGNGIVAS